jgi:phosphatidylserine decarboxylase
LEEKGVLNMSWIIFISGLVLGFGILIPVGIKWELEKKVVIPAAFFIGILSWIAVKGIIVFWDLPFYQVVIFQIFIVAAASISLLLWRFYRDPERISPEDKNAILSPADGKIIYVKRIQDGEIPFSEKNGRKFPLSDFVQSDVLSLGGYLIGISMNVLDVHVNRAPIWGRICLINHIKGLFISLKKKEAIIQNERVLTVIDNGHFKVGIIQIASRLVRTIVPYLREGNEVKSGQRIGAIRFGSQVDLILPDIPSLSIEAQPGEKVKAGLSIIATFNLAETLSACKDKLKSEV